jgi:hypothetical protein
MGAEGQMWVYVVPYLAFLHKKKQQRYVVINPTIKPTPIMCTTRTVLAKVLGTVDDELYCLLQKTTECEELPAYPVPVGCSVTNEMSMILRFVYQRGVGGTHFQFVEFVYNFLMYYTTTRDSFEADNTIVTQIKPPNYDLTDEQMKIFGTMLMCGLHRSLKDWVVRKWNMQVWRVLNSMFKESMW